MDEQTRSDINLLNNKIRFKAIKLNSWCECPVVCIDHCSNKNNTVRPSFRAGIFSVSARYLSTLFTSVSSGIS